LHLETTVASRRISDVALGDSPRSLLIGLTTNLAYTGSQLEICLYCLCEMTNICLDLLHTLLLIPFVVFSDPYTTTLSPRGLRWDLAEHQAEPEPHRKRDAFIGTKWGRVPVSDIYTLRYGKWNNAAIPSCAFL
jgi:hypothetical protein